MNADIKELNEQIAKLSLQLQAPLIYEETDDYKQKSRLLEDLKQKLAAESNNTEKEAYQKKIDKLKKEKEEFTMRKTAIRVAQAQQERIIQLETREKELAEMYEDIERGVWLTEEFTRAKSRMLDEKINSKFDTVRFKLFATQINGGQVDACEVLVNTSEGLKPFSKANTGARINGGIEIADVLGRHWGITMPIIIDNCESITQVIPTKAQQIKLYVKEGIEELTVETDRNITLVDMGA